MPKNSTPPQAVYVCSHRGLVVNEQDVKATAGEIAAMELFLSHPCKVISREELAEASESQGRRNPNSRAMDKLVHRLRERLGPERFRLLTIPNRGYFWAPPTPTVEQVLAMPAWARGIQRLANAASTGDAQCL